MKPKHWSYSSLSQFEQCPRRYKHKYHDRLADPRTPALERGIIVHEQLEHALRGRITEKKRKRTGWMEKVLDRYAAIPGVRPEQALHLDKRWQHVRDREGFYVPPGTYVTGKLDVIAPGFLSDYKTGKIYTDKHEDQAHLYATMAASVTGILRWKVELVYVDQEHIDPFEIHFDDPDGESLEDARASWTERAERMRTAREFPKQPSKLCDWCPFRKDKGGPCDGKR